MSILGKAVVKKKGEVPPVRMWLYGRPDAGKTHFAKQFPSPLLLSTDGNYVYETIPANSVDSWEVGPLAKEDQKAGAFVNLVETLRTTDHGFKTVILDLVDGAYRLAVAHYRKVLKITHESDLQWGKGYSIVTDNFIAAMEQLFKLPINVIITSHEATETIKPKGQLEYTILKPELNDRFHDIIEGYCNLVARVYSATDANGQTNRMLSLNPKEHEYGINRLGQADDLVLTHNGKNYEDFYKIWEEMNSRRDSANETVVNTVRVQATKDKLEREKEETLENLQRAKAIAEEEKAAKLEAAKKAKVTEAAEDEKADKLEDEKAAKLEAVKKAKLEALKNKKVAEKEIEEEKTVEEVKTVIVEETDDEEPVIERTSETAAKLARIAALKAKSKK